ncbi:hypothetical protein BJY04DRAFT_199821 [Aspergillus karnatakaensis]|uniref:uncharacterized protein n=1 Tax=Aspergillus karnatakaensis TaxID=1810916 RepID=UPI003CCD9AAE
MSCSTNPEAKAIFLSLRQDPAGFTHLNSDGVLRSFDGDRKVIDYRQLSPEEIKIALTAYPPDMLEQVGHKFVGVDGRDVKDEEKLLNSGADILGSMAKTEG